MKIDLSGKTALVTGSRRGIGLAIARGLADCGAHVVVNGRTATAVEQALDQLAPAGSFSAIAADVTTAQGCDAIASAYQSFDIIVGNAAVFDWKHFLETTDDDWIRHYEMNVLAAVRLARSYLPSMLEQNWGRIVLVASEAGMNSPSEMIHYGVTKAAEIALARGLAELTVGTGVTVNSVLPGPTASSGADTFLDDYAAEHGIPREDADRHCATSIRPSTLLARLATVDEVASMVVYACSREASATNGAALRAEGGLLRHFG